MKIALAAKRHGGETGNEVILLRGRDNVSLILRDSGNTYQERD